MILSPDHFFSPSEINTGYNCPYLWKCGKERQPTIAVETKFADFGHVIHESIAQYFKMISPDPHSGAIRGTIKSIVNEKLKASGLRRMDTRKEKCINNFVKFEVKRLKTWKQYIPTHIEQKKQAKVNGINYRTIGDAYWRADETIIDWKSGKMAQIGVVERIQGQVMKIVWTALGFPVKRVIFVALQTGLALEMPHTTNGFVEDKVRSLCEYDRLGYFPKKKSSLCYFCEYQLRCAFEEAGVCLWM